MKSALNDLPTMQQTLNIHATVSELHLSSEIASCVNIESDSTSILPQSSDAADANPHDTVNDQMIYAYFLMIPTKSIRGPMELLLRQLRFLRERSQTSRCIFSISSDDQHSISIDKTARRVVTTKLWYLHLRLHLLNSSFRKLERDSAHALSSNFALANQFDIRVEIKITYSSNHLYKNNTIEYFYQR